MGYRPGQLAIIRTTSATAPPYNISVRHGRTSDADHPHGDGRPPSQM